MLFYEALILTETAFPPVVWINFIFHTNSEVPAKQGVQVVGIIFQTHSKAAAEEDE